MNQSWCLLILFALHKERSCFRQLYAVAVSNLMPVITRQNASAKTPELAL